jgi:hypothetical protein
VASITEENETSPAPAIVTRAVVDGPKTYVIRCLKNALQIVMKAVKGFES